MGIAIAAIAAAGLNAASNGINQICDLEIDRINKPSRPLVRGNLSMQSAVVFTLIAYLASVARPDIGVITNVGTAHIGRLGTQEAIAKAKYYEHGFKHTAIIHSNNVRNMTKMGRVMDTTLFVKNGPSMSALGLGGGSLGLAGLATLLSPEGVGVGPGRHGRDPVVRLRSRGQ